MKIYLLPGLGFDHRIFRNLDLQAYDCTYLDWIEPLPEESIQAYAERMASDIDDQSGKTILMGHSLGGILSQEIARLKRIDTIILISSIRSRKEMPLFFKAVAPLRIYKLFTKKIILMTFPFWAKSHGFVSTEEQDLFKDMVAKQTNTYLQWALKALSLWQTPLLPAHTEVQQVHGDRDKTFPIRLLQQADHVINKAGHFMIYRRPAEIMDILSSRLPTV